MNRPLSACGSVGGAASRRRGAGVIRIREQCNRDGLLLVDEMPRDCVAVSSSFRAHPLNSAETLGPYADEAVVFEDVAEFVFAEQMDPGVRQDP